MMEELLQIQIEGQFEMLREKMSEMSDEEFNEWYEASLWKGGRK